MKNSLQIFFTLIFAAFLLIIIPFINFSPFTQLFAQTRQGTEKDLLYKNFIDNYKGTPEQQRIAYEAAIDFLQRFENSDEYAKYVEKWAAKYEAAEIFNLNRAKAYENFVQPAGPYFFRASKSGMKPICSKTDKEQNE